MALQSEIEIYIAGNRILAFQEFTLHQYLGQHHEFELVCRMDVLEKLTGGGLAENTKNYLGETLSIQATAIGKFLNYKEFQFIGIITSIDNLKAFNHKGGDMVVVGGYSGTIIADDGPHYASHNDVGLQDILMRTFTGYDKAKLETVFSPINTAPIHYSVQNNESSWQYSVRLAAQYSEWFYYDGKKLFFGKPTDTDEEAKLTYGHDLQEFRMQLKPQPNNFNYFTNDYLVNDQHQKKTSEIPNASGYNGFTSEKAAKMYAKETNVFINGYNDPQSKSRLDKQVEQQKKAAEQRQVIITGKSDNPVVALGKIVKILGQDDNYGSYRITQVSHCVNENGRYQNNFEAVSAEMDVYPLTDFNAIPRSETQTAIVTQNNDPEGMGRIQVQFPWQKRLGANTPWLRIVSPHAGSDKGFHFIPEVDEEVLVGFEGGNAERPYVLGSLYNGVNKAEAFKSEKNDIKAIRTRSGHTIELNDKSGEECIKIYDKNGNEILISTHQNTIRLEAINEINMFASNINMHASKKINIQAKEGILANSDKIGILGKNKTTIYGGNSSILGKQKVEVASPNIKYKQSGYTPPEEENNNKTGSTKKGNQNSNKNSTTNQPKTNEQTDKNNSPNECVAHWKEAELELKRKIDNWLDELINVTQDWSTDMLIEEDKGDQLSVTTYLGYLGKVLKIDPRLNVAITIGEKAYNYVSKRIATSIEIDGKFKIMRLRGDIITGFEEFKNDTEYHKKIFEAYKGYCMQQNISCKEAKDNTSIVIVNLPNKWYWYESLCISWIKSSIDTPWYKDFQTDEEAGFVIVNAVFNPPYAGLLYSVNSSDVHWDVETKFDSDVVKKKGLYKCLKFVYSKDRLNKTNLLKLPLPFTFILSTSRENGSTGIYEGMFSIIKRDENGKWQNYSNKNLLHNAFNVDIRNRVGVPVESLNSNQPVKSLIK